MSDSQSVAADKDDVAELTDPFDSQILGQKKLRDSLFSQEEQLASTMPAPSRARV